MFCSPVVIDFLWFIFEHIAPATCCVKTKKIMFVGDNTVKDCVILGILPTSGYVCLWG